LTYLIVEYPTLGFSSLRYTMTSQIPSISTEPAPANPMVMSSERRDSFALIAAPGCLDVSKHQHNQPRPQFADSPIRAVPDFDRDCMRSYHKSSPGSSPVSSPKQFLRALFGKNSSSPSPKVSPRTPQRDASPSANRHLLSEHGGDQAVSM